MLVLSYKTSDTYQHFKFEGPTPEGSNHVNTRKYACQLRDSREESEFGIFEDGPGTTEVLGEGGIRLLSYPWGQNFGCSDSQSRQ